MALDYNWGQFQPVEGNPLSGISPTNGITAPPPMNYSTQPVGGPQQGAPVGGGSSAAPAPTGGAQMPDGIAPWLAQFYQQHGITPGPRGSGVADWQYWQGEALHGASGDTGYILGRLNDEATKGGSGGGGSMGGVTPGAGYLSQIYGGQYSLPTADQLHATPGYEYGQEMAGKAVERSAASHGTLLTGGTLQRLQQNAIGLGDQQYTNLANLGLGAFNTNYNVFRNNGNDLFNRYSNLANLGYNAAS